MQSTHVKIQMRPLKPAITTEGEDAREDEADADEDAAEDNGIQDRKRQKSSKENNVPPDRWRSD